jgi:hypothetical protein
MAARVEVGVLGGAEFVEPGGAGVVRINSQKLGPDGPSRTGIP